MLSPPFLRENLPELFYPMLVLLALEPFYLDTILGKDSLFVLVYWSMEYNAACIFLHKFIQVI